MKDSEPQHTHIAVNHLRFSDPQTMATVETLREAGKFLLNADGLAASVGKVDDRHVALLPEFASRTDADRISREVQGPWMKENIVPLLAGDTERIVGEAIASSRA